MTAHQLEHASIMLEVIAFFFVTIDLYGKERLHRLSGKVSKLDLDNVSNGSFYYIIMIPVMTLETCFVFYYLYKTWLNMPLWVNSVTIIVLSTIIYIILIILALWKNKTMTRYNLKLLDALFRLFIKVILKLARIFPIEGIMLTIGAILFIIAKSLAYIAVGH